MTRSTAPSRLGGVLSANQILGPSKDSTSTVRPSQGNGFHTRFAEDLAQLAQAGCTLVRLEFDWSRLQPVPGALDPDWVEWYGRVLDSAHDIGIDVWAALAEPTGGIPRWFDDEGSFADDRTARRWWPRYVERVAETFGDRVEGWFPLIDPVGTADRWSHDTRLHESALINLAVAWRDAWRILRGGPPVAGAVSLSLVRPSGPGVPAAQAARIQDHLRWTMWLRAWRDGVLSLPNGNEPSIADLGGSLDVLGLCTTTDLGSGVLTDHALNQWRERLGDMVRRVADHGPTRPLTLAGLQVRWPHASERTRLVEATVEAIVWARDDGVDIVDVMVDPAVGERDEVRSALVDFDRNTTAETAAWSALRHRGSNPPDVQPR